MEGGPALAETSQQSPLRSCLGVRAPSGGLHTPHKRGLLAGGREVLSLHIIPTSSIWAHLGVPAPRENGRTALKSGVSFHKQQLVRPGKRHPESPHRACPVFPPSLCGMPHPSSPSDRKLPGTWGAGAGCLEAMGHSIQLPKANRPKSLSLLSLVSSAATTWTFKPQGWVACPRLLPTAHMFRSPSPSAPSESQEPECVTSQPCCGQPQAQLP